jgi:disulfide bond formation protein DsbB
MAETYFRDVHASRAAGLILLIAAATIAGAWIFQAFGIAPCELCLSERIPYYVGVPVAALTLIFALRESKALMLVGFILLFLIFAFSAGFGIYHAGVEWHFWEGPTACTGAMTKPIDVADMLKQIQTAQPPRCDDPAMRIFGVSLAGWDLVVSAALAVYAALAARLAR